MLSIGGPLARRPLLVTTGANASKRRAALTASPCTSPRHHLRSISQTCQAAHTRNRRGSELRKSLWIGIRRNSNFAPQFPSSSSSPPPPPPDASNLPPPRRSLPIRFLATLGIGVVSITIGIIMTSGATVINVAKEMGNIPTDEETLLLVNPLPEDPAHEVNEHITQHPLTKELLANPKFIASRPHLKIPPSLRSGSFTGGTLVGTDKMPVPPLVFATSDGTELVQIQYVGSALCGHPGIVHGGMLATLLDEGLARCCFPGLPNKVAVTASLKLDYRKPCMANQYVVLKAKTEKFEGRKAWVKGRLETLPADGSPGEVLVESEALFIEPRNASVLSAQRKYVSGEA